MLVWFMMPPAKMKMGIASSGKDVVPLYIVMAVLLRSAHPPIKYSVPMAESAKAIAIGNPIRVSPIMVASIKKPVIRQILRSVHTNQAQEVCDVTPSLQIG